MALTVRRQVRRSPAVLDRTRRPFRPTVRSSSIASSTRPVDSRFSATRRPREIAGALFIWSSATSTAKLEIAFHRPLRGAFRKRTPASRKDPRGGSNSEAALSWRLVSALALIAPSFLPTRHTQCTRIEAEPGWEQVQPQGRAREAQKAENLSREEAQQARSQPVCGMPKPALSPPAGLTRSRVLPNAPGCRRRCGS